MRRKRKARILRRLALAPVVASAWTTATSVTGSRRPTPRGVDPTQAPVAAGGVIRPAPFAA